LQRGNTAPCGAKTEFIRFQKDMFSGNAEVDLGIILIGALVILASAFMFKKKELDRYEGAIFVLMEIGYMWYLIANL
jgi:hypothetical protein